SFLGSVGRAEQINAAVPVGILPKLLVFRSPPPKSCDFRWGLRSTFVQSESVTTPHFTWIE
ncbi:hypothetical protein, partial [Coleofasciculus chthonoplastes]|uniref:hypothetical protein n=1 Tax=Coleofasciculus TaxID=669368 RepID=UPI0032F4D7FD